MREFYAAPLRARISDVHPGSPIPAELIGQGAMCEPRRTYPRLYQVLFPGLPRSAVYWPRCIA